ncbi:MAG: hypothetical protein K9J37_15010 [Saprospiraceae bacterium]|nr:hypothetical protein [Saprospiraceae bacterium]MCF8251219.1 hypothetical protein [Saprospiraceae bacterium]MCF8281203.1 hypothetical protein [Bacteroidales bacterium]MCF8313157.1 hypothetical protein [Saprospiraceae bacterium]MCF8441581.1 hypothetical protein [Saprospiraceae bacterium]
MQLNFDDKGYLTPDGVIETDKEVLVETFVFNQHRKKLCDSLLDFFDKLVALDLGVISCWIDGSFVTRKEIPNDIDLVVFLDFQVFNKTESRLLRFQTVFRGLLDIYFVPIFPENHKYHPITLIRKNDFLDLYSKTRRNPVSGEFSRKGILQIHL